MTYDLVLGEFLTKLYSTDNINRRFKLLEELAQNLGFEGLAYTFLPHFYLENSGQCPPVFLSSENFPQSFLEQYVEQGWDKHDFTIRRIKENKLSAMDWRYFEQVDAITLPEKELIVLAREEHGVNNAISIPCLSNNLGMAGASIVSKVDDMEFAKLKQERLKALQLAIKLFHDATINQTKSHFVPTFVLPLMDLSEKEIIILRYLSTGKPLKNIFDATGISYNYATNLMSELRRRLGGVSNEKLMYIIGLFNLFEHL